MGVEGGTEGRKAPAPPGVERALRDAYGEALVELGREREDLVVVDAGVSDSTRTQLFKKSFPQRFFNVGIAEGNLVDVAAGLALAGLRVVASSFAVFLTGRAWESIRQSIAYPALPVTLVGTHAGVSVGEDGASAQMLEDLAIMRALPNMAVLSPADAVETRLALRAAVRHPGPVYIRLNRNPSPVVFGEGHEVTIGRMTVLREGRDVAVLATGVMLPPALEAARRLAADGVEAAVVNVCSIKPLDRQQVARLAAECGALVTAEDHNVVGGLGSAVAEVLAETTPVPLERVGVADRFGQSGRPEELMKHFGLTAEGIVQAAQRALERKGRLAGNGRASGGRQRAERPAVEPGGMAP